MQCGVAITAATESIIRAPATDIVLNNPRNAVPTASAGKTKTLSLAKLVDDLDAAAMRFHSRIRIAKLMPERCTP